MGGGHWSVTLTTPGVQHWAALLCLLGKSDCQCPVAPCQLESLSRSVHSNTVIVFWVKSTISLQSLDQKNLNQEGGNRRLAPYFSPTMAPITGFCCGAHCPGWPIQWLWNTHKHGPETIQARELERKQKRGWTPGHGESGRQGLLRKRGSTEKNKGWRQDEER